MSQELQLVRYLDNGYDWDSAATALGRIAATCRVKMWHVVKGSNLKDLAEGENPASKEKE